MPLRIPPPLLLLVLFFSCSVKDSSPGSSQKNDTTENHVIRQKLATYYTDMTARNWQKYKSHFWQHATITTAWQAPGDSLAKVDVTTIEDFLNETAIGPDSRPVFEEKMTSAEIKVEGNIAEAWVDYEASFGKPDSLMHWKGKDVFTLMRHDQEWKIVSLVFETRE